MSEQEPEVVVRGTVTRELPVKLTQDEMVGTAREIGRLNAEKMRMEGEAKTSSSMWKDRIAGVEARISDLASRAHEEKEDRPVTCKVVHDYRLGEVRVVRADNNEALETRPMRPDERQPTLPGTEPAGGNVVPLDEGKRKRKKRVEAEEVAAADALTETPPPAEGDEGEPVVHEGDEQPEIADPQTVLDAAPEDDGGDKPSRKKRS